MPLDRLPPSLQHLVLLEWLSPESVWVVARAGSSVVRRAIFDAPSIAFSAGETIVSNDCACWFRKRGVPLRLWTFVVTTTNCEEHFCNGKLHRDNDLPAVLWADGSREWYQYDERHRHGDLPAVILANGTTQQWYKWGLLHREDDKPAVIKAAAAAVTADGEPPQPRWYRAWYQNGVLHREGDMPAVILPNGMQEWYFRGMMHREDGKPTTIQANGTQWWKLGLLRSCSLSADGTQRWYGNLHRLHRDDDLPAVIFADGTRMWYQDGQRHRDGRKPAVIRSDGSREWYKRDQVRRQPAAKHQISRPTERRLRIRQQTAEDHGLLW